MLTPEQQAIRGQGIGASEVAAICGLNPYKSALAVYMDKLNLTERGPETEALEWGTRLEDVIASKYAEKAAGEGLRLWRPGVTFRNPERPWMLCTPDGLLLPAQAEADLAKVDRGLECKTAGYRQAFRWGEADDAVPEQYLLQCAWSIIVTKVPRWDLAALIGGQDYREYVIVRDPDLEAMLIQIVGEFWQRVLDRKPPEPDASESAANALKRIYAKHSGDIIQANEECQSLAFALRETQKVREDAERRELGLENLLKAIIAENAGIEGAFGRITWKRSKDSIRTDWKAVAETVKAPVEIVKQHTATQPGSRRFLTAWAKED